MNSFYENQVARFIGIDEDEQGNLFCTIPSEKDMDVRYRLECKESSTGVEVLSCGCPSRKPCKHIAIVEGMWNRLYRSNVLKAEAKAAEVVEVAPKAEKVAPIEGQVWEETLECWVFPPSAEPIDHFASLKGTKVGQRKAQEQDMAQKRNKIAEIKGNLNGAQQSAVLLMELPSRKTA